MKIRCKKCEHEWEYMGNSKYYVTCPECYNKINIKKKENFFNKNEKRV
jgi:ribosomal protein S27E